MARLGFNVKLTIDAAWRSRVRRLFVDLLGASPSEPSADLEVYRLDGDGRVGVYYVGAGQALGPGDQAKGAWLELRVGDPDGVARRLRDAGIAEVEYHDRAHAYFQVPGGPVFRLAGPLVDRDARS